MGHAARYLNTLVTNQLLYTDLPMILPANHLDGQNYFRFSQQVKVVLKSKRLMGHLNYSLQIYDLSFMI